MAIKDQIAIACCSQAVTERDRMSAGHGVEIGQTEDQVIWPVLGLSDGRLSIPTAG